MISSAGSYPPVKQDHLNCGNRTNNVRMIRGDYHLWLKDVKGEVIDYWSNFNDYHHDVASIDI